MAGLVSLGDICPFQKESMIYCICFTYTLVEYFIESNLMKNSVSKWNVAIAGPFPGYITHQKPEVDVEVPC